MGQSTQELNTEIAGTRQALSSDLDALQDKVSPSAIIDRRKAAARGRLSGIKNSVMGSGSSATSSVGDTAHGAVHSAEQKVEGSPLAAGLVAFGAGLLVAALVPASDAESRASQKLVDTAKEHGQPVVDQAKAAGQELAEGLKGPATDAVQEVKETAQQSAERVQGQGQSSVENVKSDHQV
jgi:gas vesicle protein